MVHLHAMCGSIGIIQCRWLRLSFAPAGRPPEPVGTSRLPGRITILIGTISCILQSHRAGVKSGPCVCHRLRYVGTPPRRLLEKSVQWLEVWERSQRRIPLNGLPSRQIDFASIECAIRAAKDTGTARGSASWPVHVEKVEFPTWTASAGARGPGAWT